MLADRQAAAADVIWHGDPDARVRALASNPLVMDPRLAASLLAARTAA